MTNLSEILAAIPQDPRFGSVSAPASGRSTLLRAGLVSGPRDRAFWVRRRRLALRVGIVVLLLTIIAGRWFGTGGLMYPVYLVHDRVWLPLAGRFWVMSFPFGLIWLVPLVGLSGLVMLEYLGFAPLIRRTQIAVIRALRGRGMDALLIKGDRLGRRFGYRSDLVRAVVDEYRQAARHAALVALDRNDVPQLSEYLRHQALFLRLGDGTPFDLLQAVEALAIASLSQNLTHAEGLRKAIAEMTTDPAWTQLADAFGPDLTLPDESTVLSAADRLALGPVDPVAAAVGTMIVAIALRRRGAVLMLVWFDVWARARVGRDNIKADRLVAAEGLIGFEFWAAMSEGGVKAPPSESLLTEVFGASVGPRIRGESFARHGARP